jgi:hypothetical protein
MKKLAILIAAIALVAFTVPAMAVDWNFYGNARMATYYTSANLSQSGGATDEIDGLQWDFQGNSRIGAKVKADNIKAQFEFGVSEANVYSRRLYATWNFGPGSLKVGKDYTPMSQFISGQVFDSDLGLLGIGTNYGSRHGQIALSFGAFNIALINPSSTTTLFDNDGNAVTGGTIKQYTPKFEASWGMGFDTWNFALQGGFQYYSIKDKRVPNTTNTKDVEVTSWTLGANAGVNFGPAYVKAAGSVAQNPGNAGWNIPYNHNQGGFAGWNGKSSTKDTISTMGALVGGIKVSDMLSFEAGAGIRNDSPDEAHSSLSYSLYGQSVIVLAPGVYLIPEIGYFANGEDMANVKQGNQYYAGAKWQINF